ncbi:histidine kinase [Nonomuraea sp. B19D2]|uniref:sensor histidine kinase n=1 Tax=Nonomuraea sp. B19D2 TaxID=3159561 RepID=UPI0032DB3962
MTKHPFRADAALAVGCSVWHIGGWLAIGPVPSTGQAALLGAAMCLPTLPLAWRRTRPWVSFCGVVAGYCVWLFTVGAHMTGQIGMIFVMISLYSAARWTARPRSLVAAAIVGTVLAVPELARTAASGAAVAEVVLEGTALTAFLFGIPVCVWLAGNERRRAHEDAARLRELAERLRAGRELNARHAVLTERARIAGDLHDVVAGQVSAIALTARTVEGSEQARLIAATADQALEDMRRIIGLLADGAEEIEPRASLADLDRLIKIVEVAGCRVTGPASLPQGLSSSVETSAYRIIQEALTNVVKHAGPTDVEVCLTQAPLTITVTNGPRAHGHEAESGSGLGMIGLRERAALYGGTLEAGPHRDGWRVRAVLPTAERT